MHTEDSNNKLTIHTSGHGIKLTDAINQYIEQRFSHIGEHFHKIQKIRITLKPREGHEFRVTADVVMAGGQIHADSKDDDLYKAIDLLKQKVAKQVDKHHDLLMQRHHHQDKEH